MAQWRLWTACSHYDSHSKPALIGLSLVPVVKQFSRVRTSIVLSSYNSRNVFRLKASDLCTTVRIVNVVW